MKRICVLGLALLAGCSSSSPTAMPAKDGGLDGTVGDANGSDGPAADSPGTDGSDAADSGGEATDAGAASASDGSDGGPGEGAPDVVMSDGACPAPELPSDDPFTVDASTTVILHASGAGTQNYTCEATAVDGGTDYVWTFVGPQAALSDCNAAVVAQHFASEAGAGFPEWQATDGTYVIAQKQQAYTPDGGSGSVPWLLLGVVSGGGDAGGALSGTQYVERIHTDGGVAPSGASCSSDAGGTTEKVPYTADYYFLAP
jgi:hypothetical protein